MHFGSAIDAAKVNASKRDSTAIFVMMANTISVAHALL
jgi:hypothetical protein